METTKTTLTVTELKTVAKMVKLQGRSKMNKAELEYELYNNHVKQIREIIESGNDGFLFESAFVMVKDNNVIITKEGVEVVIATIDEEEQTPTLKEDLQRADELLESAEVNSTFITYKYIDKNGNPSRLITFGDYYILGGYELSDNGIRIMIHSKKEFDGLYKELQARASRSEITLAEYEIIRRLVVESSAEVEQREIIEIIKNRMRLDENITITGGRGTYTINNNKSWYYNQENPFRVVAYLKHALKRA